MLPPLPNLEDYQISENGFLPAEPPIDRLPDRYYDAWENVASNLRSLIADKKIREAVDELPLLSTSRLHSEAEWRRAYVVLGFISNSYIWGLVKAKDVCPPPSKSYGNWLLTDLICVAEITTMHRNPVPRGFGASGDSSGRYIRCLLPVELPAYSPSWTH